MNQRSKLPLPLLSTGVPGLDTILGGGLPEYSFNLISGLPGSGKTTLAHQIVFANATRERPALYLTVLGEPPIKMLRYQQQMAFFAPAAVGESVFFANLSEIALRGTLESVLARIVELVEERAPAIVVVDSFQTLLRNAPGIGTELTLQGFVQQLAIYLTSWEATTFLIGEYPVALQDNPVYTVADGILSLTQSIDRNSVVRKIQVVKSRGQAPMPGLHTFRITVNGIEAFPRILASTEELVPLLPRPRVSSGVELLDEMLGGGVRVGDSLLISGPSGAGKSVLATQFITAGVRDGDASVLAVFEERPAEYVRRAKSLSFDLKEMIEHDQLRVIYIRPLDLSPDETLQEIRDAVAQIGAKRVVIDSLSGFELALAPTFRLDFRESMYRLVSSLTQTGVTVLMTMEIVQSTNGLQFSPNVISFLADDIVLLRYVEIAGEIRKALVVIKTRGSDHSAEIHAYEITANGIVIGESLREYRGILSGSAERRAIPEERFPGLIAEEADVLRDLFTFGETAVIDLAQRMGLLEEKVTVALRRLVALDYVSARIEANHPTMYRATAQKQ